MLRTHTCGELRKPHQGQSVQLAGWVHHVRDLGGMIFITLRDRYGLTQIVFNPELDEELYTRAQQLRPEWVITVNGTVRSRPENMVNPDRELGDLEIEVKDIKILNEAKTPVFEIGTDGYEVNEETRLKYRYLDLRRGRLQKNLAMRHKVVTFIRDYLSEKGLFLLLDLVSGDYEHRNTRPFTTQIMSDELNQFVQMPNSQLSYILPICCGFWSDGCRTQQCYIERQFEIKHSRRTRDITKVTYRVMVKKLFARQILENVQAKEHYQMSYNSWHPRYCRNTSVIEKTNETELPNAFKLI